MMRRRPNQKSRTQAIWLMSIAGLVVVTLMILVFSQTSLRSSSIEGLSSDLESLNQEPEPELKLLPVTWKDGDCKLSHKALGMVESTTIISTNDSNLAIWLKTEPSESLAASVGLEPTKLLAQFNEDIILGAIFEAIGVKHKQCVEFGKYCPSLHPSTVSSKR